MESWRRPSVGGGEDKDERVDPERLGSIARARRKKRRRPSSDLLREASIIGGEWRRPRLCRGHGAAPRVSAAGVKRRGRRSRWSRGSSLTSLGGQGTRGAAVEATGGHGHGASDPPVATVTMVLTGEAHCQGFVFFPVFRNSSRL